MDSSLPGSSLHGILQARILEWVAISYSRGSSPTQGSNPCLLHLLHWQADSLPLVASSFRLLQPMLQWISLSKICFHKYRRNLERIYVVVPHTAHLICLVLLWGHGRTMLPCPPRDRCVMGLPSVSNVIFFLHGHLGLRFSPLFSFCHCGWPCSEKWLLHPPRLQMGKWKLRLLPLILRV